MAPTNPSFVRRLQVLLTMTIVVMMVSSQHRDGGGLALVAAVDHNVGGSSNWDLSVDYTTWASAQTFAVGDNLVFTWTGNHDVVVVSEADYNGCTTSSSSASLTYRSSPKSIPLTAAGTTYYICSITGHCGAGMKVAVTVAAASSSSPPPPSSSSSSSPPPPPPSSSSSPPPPSSSSSSSSSPPPSSNSTSTTPSSSPPPPPPPPPPSSSSSSSSSSSTPGSSDSPSMFRPSLFTTAIILCLSLLIALLA